MEAPVCLSTILSRTKMKRPNARPALGKALKIPRAVRASSKMIAVWVGGRVLSRRKLPQILGGQRRRNSGNVDGMEDSFQHTTIHARVHGHPRIAQGIRPRAPDTGLAKQRRLRTTHGVICYL